MTICPTTAEDWVQAEQRKSCATGIYHCLRTQLNFPIEVCAPGKTLIRPGGCPYWNINGNVDMVDCRKYPQCPDKPFLSNEVYQYPFCYQSWSTTTTYNTSVLPNTTTTMLASNTVSAERPEHEQLLFIVLMVILSCTVLVVVVFVFIIRYYLRVRRRQKDPEIPFNGGELTYGTYTQICRFDPEIPFNGRELTYGAYIQLSRRVVIAETVTKEDPEILVYGGELTNEPSTQTTLLEPETPVNDGVLSEETSTQTQFLVATEGKEIKEDPSN